MSYPILWFYYTFLSIIYFTLITLIKLAVSYIIKLIIYKFVYCKDIVYDNIYIYIYCMKILKTVTYIN